MDAFDSQRLEMVDVLLRDMEPSLVVQKPSNQRQTVVPVLANQDMC